ncbi:DMT family transporter [Noviherbaspirillum autotrophicum]|uniref:Membrane protein n=1 Tax=Noviherbaspirillum autotrophicum TaxID=709839 RepID=A0A0C1YL20_9BURK|nr:DMT family transporter [Noviherbaspirillum autotrophicum]KIF81207.1 membrane protein [Noviherbaspirillum autotrophicum]
MQSLWMLFASFAFSIMGLCVKLASSLYSTAEIVMYRGAVGVLFMFTLIRLHGGSFKTGLPWHHLWRGLIGVVALWLWFYAIGKLPLAAGMTLNYMSPIWIAAILFTAGWWYGQNRFEWGLAAAIACSFVGVTLLLRPVFHAEQWFAALVGLASGVLSALAYLQVRKLGQMGEPESRVVFYFSLTGLAAGVMGTLASHTTWHPHSGKGLFLLVSIGVTATVAQIAMTRAYRLGKTLVTANLQYTGIVFSSIWGVLLWDDNLGWLGWLGIAVILLSGLAATYYNTRKINAPAGRPSAAEANDPIATEV